MVMMLMSFENHILPKIGQRKNFAVAFLPDTPDDHKTGFLRCLTCMSPVIGTNDKFILIKIAARYTIYLDLPPEFRIEINSPEINIMSVIHKQY
jgi:hypothetical protein